MKIHRARHYGMCFGVRDALRLTHQRAERAPVTVLGQLVHNPAVDRHLATLGVRRGELDAPEATTTGEVVITAHGAADRDRERLNAMGFTVTDTTCPLVRRAHNALAALVAAGFHPVVIGQPGHVEVRGLIGDFPASVVIEGEDGIDAIPPGCRKIGIVSQTTQPIDRVTRLVEAIRRRFADAEVSFRDTVCQPTKDRQSALAELCTKCETVVVIGGRNSNNTRQLVAGVEKLGRTARHVEGPDDLRPEWFLGVEAVGVTAGTSTLDETVDAVCDAIRRMDAARQLSPLAGLAALCIGRPRLALRPRGHAAR